MHSITVSGLEPDLEARLHMRAARHGRSPESEARIILGQALGIEPGTGTGADLVREIRALVAPFGGIELELPPRRLK